MQAVVERGEDRRSLKPRVIVSFELRLVEVPDPQPPQRSAITIACILDRQVDVTISDERRTAWPAARQASSNGIQWMALPRPREFVGE